MKKNGVLLITTPHDPNQWNKLDDYARHERRYTVSQIKETLKNFSDIDVYTLGFPFHRIVIEMYNIFLKFIHKNHKAKWFRQSYIFYKIYYFLGSILLFIDDHFNQIPLGTTIIAIVKK
ncbi:hypothetical protein A3D77_03950 [Candidatus Gottesmanbacteria bacterium RIFCSPHIGHO2_02_FULL_39_11]|uniref:Methyltransferase type 11 domain-containing protein n=1 Tax=Candidatus Gottesmanbacteria bacterium RIFCSPHIGHO2_02_FULL_39_11 TaxID=1798382 RepID=A0A1F5ZJW6_9BACT|nr:MAG: hypothetical protein A3D77_03950 [Candidatus Gottesmanbacteria bacterium RIFCSPHIGHO2_02_FULL_39_11]